MPFKDFSYLELWWLLCSAERNHCAVLEQGIMRKIYVKLFKFGPVVQEMSFKNISYLELWWAFVHQSGTIRAILIEGIMRNNSVKLS